MFDLFVSTNFKIVIKLVVVNVNLRTDFVSEKPNPLHCKTKSGFTSITEVFCYQLEENNIKVLRS
ncbi:hypothetical protein DPV73_05920 [Leptospira mayottensis]|nr:hypothetical protein DPV73_05920 [Leptospira mayottensis]